MMNYTEEDLDFVTQKYSSEHFDPEKALSSFKNNYRRVSNKRLIITLASSAASVLVAMACGYGVAHYVTADSQEKFQDTVIQSQELQVESVHVFSYDNTPLPFVLEELSSYYGCTLICEETNVRLSGTFESEDINFIVSCIEQVLDVTIIIGE